VKWVAWEKFLEGEEGESFQDSVNKCWIALRYTKTQAQSTSTTPSLKLKDSEGNIIKIISTQEEKERIFLDQGFPPQELEEVDDLL